MKCFVTVNLVDSWARMYYGPGVPGTDGNRYSLILAAVFSSLSIVDHILGKGSEKNVKSLGGYRRVVKKQTSIFFGKYLLKFSDAG